MPIEGETRVGSATVRWRQEGSGPAIVLIHGFPLSGRTWDPVVQRLRNRFRCLMPDVIGLGGSRSYADEDYSSQGQARALRDTLTAQGLKRYALVGNDSGGWIARELALIDHERVSHLVLTNTEIPGHRPPWIPIYQALAGVPGFGLVLRQMMRIPGFIESPMAFGGCFHDPRRLDREFRDNYVEPLSKAGPRLEGALRFLRCMKFSRLDEFRKLHGELRMPTMFIWGRDDPTFPEPLARQMTEQFPVFAGFHSVPDAKLFFYEEHPDAVTALIDRFMLAPEDQAGGERATPL